MMGSELTSFISKWTICLLHLLVVRVDGAAQIEYHVTGNPGLVKLSAKGTIGSICAKDYDEHDARVICRSLNLPDTDARPLTEAYSEKNGPVVLNTLDCFGNESSLEECPKAMFGIVECPTQELVRIYCNSAKDSDLRLMSGITLTAGRVEVYHKGQWGTVSTILGDKILATVLCKGLRWPYKMSHRFYGTGMKTQLLRSPWIESMECNGTESSWLHCNFTFNSRPGSITRYRELYISCEDLQLSGRTSTSGILQGYFHEKWRPVYSPIFTSVEASVACKTLGLPRSSAKVLNIGKPDVSKVETVLDVHDCNGHEALLTECYGTKWVSKSSADVVISCEHADTTDVSFQLVDGIPGTLGRLQVFYNRAWGNICKTGVGEVEATVACRTLGYAGVKGHVIPTDDVKEGHEPVVLHGLKCFGNESSLKECYFNPWNIGTCYDWQTLAIYCGSLEKNYQVRLMDEASGNNYRAGRVETYVYGMWRRVCGQQFAYYNEEAARVVCEQLNYLSSAATGTECFQDGTGVTWNRHFSCYEKAKSLKDCSASRILTGERCYDLGVICSNSWVDDKDCFRLTLPTWAYFVLVGVGIGIIIATCCVVSKVRERKRAAASRGNVPPQRYVVRGTDNHNNQDVFHLNIPSPQLSDPPPAYDTLFKTSS